MQDGGGGSGPNDPTIELRLSRLETDLRQCQTDIRGVRDELVRLRETLLEKFANSDKEIARLVGQVSQLPTTWTMATTFISTVGVVAALGFAVARLLGRP